VLLENKVGIVSGIGPGVGRSVALRFAREGADVALAARSESVLLDVAKEVEALGRRAICVPTDVTNPEQCRHLADATRAAFGRVDILVNNAAMARSTRFPDLSADEWRETLEVNLTAPFLLTKAVLPTMKSQGYGRIVNVSSSAGRMVSTLGGAHYTASKAGLLGLTRAAAKELGKFGVTVNAICPGMIDTELTHENATPDLLERLAAGYPVPRLGTALEVADLICFAASEAAGYITGAAFDINGGDLMM
jgi:NAD(P)-dependent dehydrogenase (short-subunit alcohol dehydrogenase family)